MPRGGAKARRAQKGKKMKGVEGHRKRIIPPKGSQLIHSQTPPRKNLLQKKKGKLGKRESMQRKLLRSEN